MSIIRLHTLICVIIDRRKKPRGCAAHITFYPSLSRELLVNSTISSRIQRFHDDEAFVNNLSSLHAFSSGFIGVAMHKDHVQTNEGHRFSMHSINDAATALGQSENQYDDH